MRKLYTIFFLFSLFAQFSFGAIYYYVGGNAATVTWNTATTAWSTVGVGGAATGSAVTPSGSDTFIFDGTDISSTVGLQTGTVTVAIGASITCGQVKLQNGANVIYACSSSGRNITINGAIAGDDFVVPNGCTWTTNGSTEVMTIATGNTASITGTYNCGAGANSHSFVCADTSGIIFNSGSSFVFNSNVNPFGTTVNKGVIFASGSTYQHTAGSNPFAMTAPSSCVVFQTGSNYKSMTSSGFSFSNRVYANLEIAAGTHTITGSGGTVDNISVTGGAFNNNTTSTTFIKGNITVASTTTLAFSPASAATVAFAGTTAQTITNSGTLTFGANATIVDTNSTSTVTFASAFTTSGLVRVAPSCTLATAATHTASGGVTVNGSYQLNTGGYATGTFTYGASGTLIFNSSSLYGFSSTHTYWPSSSGPVNVSVLSGGMSVASGAARTVTGTFTCAAPCSLLAASVLTISGGTFQINSGGYVATNAVVYSGTATLAYSTMAVPIPQPILNFQLQVARIN